MEKYYRFAGLELAVDLPDERMYRDEKRLGTFAVTAVDDPHRFRFFMVPELTAPRSQCVAALRSHRYYREGEWQIRYIGSVEDGWSGAYIRVASRDREHRVELKESLYTGCVGTHSVLTAMDVEHLMAQNDGFVFHCAYIEHNGEAILFTAPSGTGKSTQAELWRELRNARIINGDRAAVRWDGRRLMAEGIPFCGSSPYCENRSLPIRAIVYLGQAPRTSIRPMAGYAAFSRIWEGVGVHHWEREDLEKVTDVVQRLISSVPIFYMPCTPDESAVIALEQALESR